MPTLSNTSKNTLQANNWSYVAVSQKLTVDIFVCGALGKVWWYDKYDAARNSATCLTLSSIALIWTNSHLGRCIITMVRIVKSTYHMWLIELAESANSVKNGWKLRKSDSCQAGGLCVSDTASWVHYQGCKVSGGHFEAHLVTRWLSESLKWG